MPGSRLYRMYLGALFRRHPRRFRREERNACAVAERSCRQELQACREQHESRHVTVREWELDVDLTAKLEYCIFVAGWPLIWWIFGGVRPPRSVTTASRPDSTLMRH